MGPDMLSVAQNRVKSYFPSNPVASVTGRPTWFDNVSAICFVD